MNTTASPARSTPSPVLAGSRIQTLDVLRGFALLGILGPNIFAFSWPSQSMYDPSVIGVIADRMGDIPHAEANSLAHHIVQVFFLGKMMMLFSLLFGAGVVMYARKFERPGGAPVRLTDGAGLWYTRVAWLLVIGLLHAVGLWFGDILVTYAVAALGFVWWVRRLRPMLLLAIGSVSYLAGAAMMLAITMAGVWAQSEGHADLSEGMFTELEAYRGSYADALLARIPILGMMYLIFIPFSMFWIASGMFCAGMALTKWGFLTGALPSRVYALTAALGLALGVPITLAVIEMLERSGMAMPGFIFQSIAQPVGIPIAMAYASAIILLVKHGWLGFLTSRLADVGRMAFTNYLLQTIICTTLFYGYGFEYFARIQYPQLWWVVAGVWIVNILFSAAWLSVFRFGPAEWVWRSLTYFRPQPMLRGDPAPTPDVDSPRTVP